MAEYSIRDLENFTDIKAHTLRIWEQRYKLLEPRRTDTNIRYYSDKDLKKILNINLLYSNGLKISRIAQLTEEEITAKATQLLFSENCAAGDLVNSFIGWIVAMNESEIVRKLNELNDLHGMEHLYMQTLVPLLRRIGDLWQVDTLSVSHEHFFSNILREFFIVKIGQLPSPAYPKGSIVLFLHEQEQHELGLLFYYHYLKSRSYACYYLGQSVPLKDLQLLVEELQPDYLLTSLIADVGRSYLKAWMQQLCSFFPAGNIYMGGYQLKRYPDLVPQEIQQIHEPGDLKLQ